MTIVALLLRHPNASVVSKRLTHQSQLGLEVTGLRNASRVDLGVTGVGEESSPLVTSPGSRHIAVHGVGGKIKHGSVAPGAEQHGVSGVTLYLTCDKVAGDDAPSLAVLYNQVQHFTVVVELHVALVHLPRE